MSRILLYLIFFGSIGGQCVAQYDCGQLGYMNHLRENQYPTYNHYMENYDRILRKFIDKNKTTREDTIFRIPVFFNVLSRNGRTVNFEKLDTMLAVLNRGFNRGDDTSIVRDIFSENIADIKIEFYRAILDINGDTIKRLRAKNSFYLYETDDLMKYDASGLSAYHPEKYLNIWICNMSKNLGYATPPIYAAHWPSAYFKPLHLQGIVLDFRTIVPEYSSDFEKYRKIIIHEAGHYLGLRHTWGDGSLVITGDSTECWRDDGIKDTPYTIAANRTCDNNKNTCIEKQGIDYPDQYENYMDYTDNRCQAMFTNEQKELMIYNLVNLRPYIYDTAYVDITIPEPASLAEQKTISLYPNPASNQVNIEVSSHYFEQKLELHLYSTDGKLVYRKSFTPYSKENVALLSISSGLYYAAILEDNRTIFRSKLIVLGP